MLNSSQVIIVVKISGTNIPSSSPSGCSIVRRLSSSSRSPAPDSAAAGALLFLNLKLRNGDFDLVMDFPRFFSDDVLERRDGIVSPFMLPPSDLVSGWS